MKLFLPIKKSIALTFALLSILCLLSPAPLSFAVEDDFLPVNTTANISDAENVVETTTQPDAEIEVETTTQPDAEPDAETTSDTATDIDAETTNDTDAETTTDIDATTDVAARAVMDYAELLHALTLKSEKIALGKNILLPGDGLNITYDCTIEGNGFHLIQQDNPGSSHMITVHNNVNFALNNALLDGNNIPSGSAIRALPDSTLTLNSIAVENNILSDDNSNGGGIFADTNVTLTLTNCVIQNNSSTNNGGGIFAGENATLTLTDCVVQNNSAANNGGGIYLSTQGLTQIGGVICDNHAGVAGGGVYNGGSDRDAHPTNFKSGMTFDNTAEIVGDDVFKVGAWDSIYATQANRIYDDDKSLERGSVTLELVPGYAPPTRDDKVSVPYYGWFVDGEIVGSADNVLPNSRYDSPALSVMISANNGNLRFLSNDDSISTGGKAVWYGLLLIYDSNFLNDDNTTDYQYDSNAYLPDSNAIVLPVMFDRDDHTFTVWNTLASGDGTDYLPGEKLSMEQSQVLYAQWQADTAEPPTEEPTPDDVPVSDDEPASDELTASADALVPKAGGHPDSTTLLTLATVSLSGIAALSNPKKKTKNRRRH